MPNWNWHDYEVESRREIVALLRQIAEKNQLVRLLIKGESDVCVTSILDVDPDSDTLILDRSVSREQNERIAAARRRCAARLRSTRSASCSALDGLSETSFEGGTALRAAIPASLIRLQRREFYRMATPVTNPVRATDRAAGRARRRHGRFPAGRHQLRRHRDLRQQAAARHDDRRDASKNCRIDLPESARSPASLQVRNSLDMTLLNNKTNRRLGCQFSRHLARQPGRRAALHHQARARAQRPPRRLA
jgi:hypothetical protein